MTRDTRAKRRAARIDTTVERDLDSVLRWYCSTVYGVHEGPSVVPFYCDPQQVGGLSVDRSRLARGEEGSLFRLFVALSMYQGVRDVVVMERQRGMLPTVARSLSSPTALSWRIGRTRCDALESAEKVIDHCDVFKAEGIVDCRRTPGVDCPVKTGSRAMGRMGDMGKLPVSALLTFGKDGGLTGLFELVVRSFPRGERAAELVNRLTRVHRVGTKLGSLFVSAVSTPALAPGLVPWFPEIDGNDVVVVDTNVARAVDLLSRGGASSSYDSRAVLQPL